MEKARKQIIRTPTWDMSGAERLAIWRRAKSVLSKRKGALLKEYRKMRREWAKRDKQILALYKKQNPEHPALGVVE